MAISADILLRFEEACANGDLEFVRKTTEREPGISSLKFDFKGSEGWRHDGQGTGLHIAARNSHLECCRELLDRGADVDANDGHGATPLMYAASYAVFKLLLSRGASVHARNDAQWTPLHYCAYYKWSYPATLDLMNAGADIRARNGDNQTPMMVAVRESNTAFVLAFRPGNTDLHTLSKEVRVGVEDDIEILVLAGGADLEVKDDNLRTPLIIAVLHTNYAACDTLIKLGANVNAEDRDGDTPLHVSLRMNLTNFSARLVEGGATFRNESSRRVALLVFSGQGYERAACKLVEEGVTTEVCDKAGNTALHLAAKNRATQVVGKLIKAGARIDARNKRGEEPVVLAHRAGHVNTTMELVKAGARLDVAVRDSFGNTFLHLAASQGDTNMAYEQIKAGASMEASNQGGNTPLLVAAAYGHTQLVTLLLTKAGAKANVQNRRGETGIILALKHGHVETVRALVESGADVHVNASDKDRNTAMLLALNWVQFASIPFQAKADTPVEGTDGDTQAPKLAAQPSIAALIKALLSAGASMSSGLNAIGQTPMHIAARYGDEQLAHLLMDQGADIDARDKGGNTALLLAVKHGQPTLAQALIKMGANVHLRNNQGHIALFVALGIEDCDRKLCSELIRHGEPAQDLRTVAPFLRKAASEGDVPALTFLTSLSVRISINTGYDGGSVDCPA